MMNENPTRAFSTPPVDIFEGDDAFVLAIDLPGVQRDDINLQIENGKLSIDALRGENGSATSYRRVFDVDRTVDETQLSAILTEGVLTVTLPKAESTRPLTIPVTVR